MDLKRALDFINIVNLMITALMVLILYNLYSSGINDAFSIVIIVLTASLLDLAIKYIKEKHLYLPKTAIITGMILSLIVQTSLLFLILVAAIAILSKHIIKIKGRHIFNPANFALFVALFLPVSESWWGMNNILLVAVLGLVVVYKLRRYHVVLPFLAVNGLLMMAVFSAGGGAGQVVGHFASGPLLFFMFYMLIEPVTSPTARRNRIIFGMLAGMFVAILYLVWLPAMLVGALFFADLCVPVLDCKLRPKPIATASSPPRNI